VVRRAKLIIKWSGADNGEQTRLIGVNIVSLCSGVLANITFMFVYRQHGHELHPSRFSSDRTLMVLTIIGWYMASILLIALVVATNTILNLHSSPNRAATQAFHYAIFAAILYFLEASLMMIFTFIMAKPQAGCHHRLSRIAHRSRKLMGLTIFFMIYILLGALVFSHIEGWKYLDGVYWADVTLLTIGFGDFKPMSRLGRSLLFPYAGGGNITLAVIVYSITQLAKQSYGESIEINRGKKWERTVKKLAGKDKETKFKEMKEYRMKARASTALKQKARSGVLWAVSFLVFWLCGAAILFIFERHRGWTYFHSVYFAFTSLFTIGYGDFYPQTNFGKAFFVMWSLLAVPVMTITIAHAAETWGDLLFFFDWDDLVALLYTKVRNHWNNCRRRFGSPNDERRAEATHDKDKQPHGRTGNAILGAEENIQLNTRDENCLLVSQVIRVLKDHLDPKEETPMSYELRDWDCFISLIRTRDDGHDNGGIIDPLRQWRYESAFDWNSEYSPLMNSRPETELLLKSLLLELKRQINQFRGLD